MIVVKQVYAKPGATFASSSEAYADKNSLYPAELSQKITEFKALLRTSSILLEDEQYEWDQATQTLAITRKLTDKDIFTAAALDFDPDFVQTTQFEDYAMQAGWTKVDTVETIIE